MSCDMKTLDQGITFRNKYAMFNLACKTNKTHHAKPLFSEVIPTSYIYAFGPNESPNLMS